MSTVILMVLPVIAGVIVGYTLCYIVAVPRTFGTLRIDQTNPETDIYRLDIDELDKLADRKRIVLKVDKHANLSQE